MEQEMIYGVLNKFFSNFINTGSSRIKTGSRKYERDTPLPSPHPISIFTDKYGNKWKNIEIQIVRDEILSVRFHPYQIRTKKKKASVSTKQLIGEEGQVG